MFWWLYRKGGGVWKWKGHLEAWEVLAYLVIKKPFCSGTSVYFTRMRRKKTQEETGKLAKNRGGGGWGGREMEKQVVT